MKTIAPPRTLGSIRQVTQSIRSTIAIEGSQRFPVWQVMEALDKEAIEHSDGGKEFVRVGFKDEMGVVAGKTDPNSGVIILREDMFNDLYEDGAEGRFTFIHEFGHRIFHTGMPLNRVDSDAIISTDVCVESQADSFACELLLDIKWLIKNIAIVPLATMSKIFGLPAYMIDQHIDRLVNNGDLKKGIQMQLAFEQA